MAPLSAIYIGAERARVDLPNDTDGIKRAFLMADDRGSIDRGFLFGPAASILNA
jgi:hypothetical protein